MHPTPQSPVKAKLIGQILVESKAITSDQLEKALNRQAEEGGLICTLVVRLGMAQPAQVFGALAQQLGVPYADLKHETIDPAAVEKYRDAFTRYRALYPAIKGALQS